MSTRDIGLAVACLLASSLPACDAGSVPRPADGSGSAASAAPVTTALRFRDAGASLGLDVRHHPGRSADKLMPEILGGGVALADLDRDGDPDLLFVDSGDVLAPIRPDSARNRLFLNDGSGHFTDATDAWELPSPGYGMGVAVGDVDGDGWPDVFLTTFGSPDVLLQNTGNGFEDVSRAAGLGDDAGWSTSAGFLDHDGDGDLDLYVVRYVAYDPATALRCHEHRVHVYCTPVVYEAAPDRLLRNDGDGTFTDISRETGLHVEPGKGLALATGDVDGDGHADVYVANDSTRNALLLGDGLGGLTDVAPLRGVAYGHLGREEAGMGVDLADLDGDGRLDIVCTNFQGEATAVYCPGDDGLYRERSDAIGVGGASRQRLSFGVDAFDADNDGDEDLLVANGHIDDVVATHRTGISFPQRNTLYEQVAPGELVDVSVGAGSALQAEEVSRGLATADLDGDGDLDFVVVNNGGPLRVGLNESEPMGNWIGLWLEGRDGNRSAIGTRVTARVGGRTLVRTVLGASSYLSVSDPRVHIGLGDADGVDALTIHWPGGFVQELTDLPAGRYLHIVEGDAPVPFRPGEETR